MLHSNFVHLHVHTQYSLLDGACLIGNLIDKACEFKMPALAITDHGNMFGAIEFYEACINKGIKPIIGCEVYIAPQSRFEKTSRGIQEASFHMTLLVKNEVGFKNLMRLVSMGYLEGFYYKPRIDKELLKNYSKGLIGLSGCLKGELSHLILSDQIPEAVKLINVFKEIFEKDSFFLEIQDQRLPEQLKTNPALLNLSKDLDVPVVATNDVHYILKEHAKAHDALLCIQTQTTLDDPNRMRLKTDEFYFKSYDEMSRLFSNEPKAISNSMLIAQMCNLELDLKQTHLPHYTLPDPNLTREEFLQKLVHEGLNKRYPKLDDTIKERVKYELNIIKNSGYISYFLIVWDFINFAKTNGIPVGPGRGSAAGSVVSYALGITDIDPLKYDLIFERFLNPERVSLPDIDIDFCYERRSEVIDYVVKRYSKDNVAQIITFGTMQARAVVRDVGRVMGISYSEVDRIAKLIPPDPNMTLSHAIQSEPELRSLYKTDQRVKELMDTSLILEGLTRHASTHAAGVVISEKPLMEHIPLFKTADEQITTGFSMDSIAKVGLLKMDFLGLRTLTVIDEAIKITKRTKDIDIDITTIALDDEKTFELLRDAKTIGIFQLESSGMRDLLRKLQPEKFEDIVALLALYRPGPIGSGMLDDFIKRKHGQIKIQYDHPKLEPILKETYGIIVYQEQVMRIASSLAGFSLGLADSLRRAMSKKIPEEMEKQRNDFINGAAKNGIDQKAASKIFDLIEYFAGYGFNKSHSAAYAMISYRTAYLKANFPVEFMAALLTSERDNTDKIALYIDEAHELGVKILPPDVNESFANFTVVADSIRFGLSAVKNVGGGAIESIVKARNSRKANFASLYEFTESVDLRLANRKVIESLIKCGAFDSFKLFRSQLMSMLDHALEVAGSVQRDRLRGQLSLFDCDEGKDYFKNSIHQMPDIKEWPENQLLSYEKESIGFYITGHPLARYQKLLKIYTTSSISDLGLLKDGVEIRVGGIIIKIKHTSTKKTNERMAIISVEDLNGTVEVLVFPKTFQDAAKYIKKEAMVLLRGRLSLREEEPKIIANELIPIEDVREKCTKAVRVKLVTTGLEEPTLTELKNVLANHRGGIPVYLDFFLNNSKAESILVPKDLFITPNDNFICDIERLLGIDAITFVT